MRRVVATDPLSLSKDMYRHEKAVAEALAQHVAALLKQVNHVETDWRIVYTGAHLRVERERQ